MKNLLLLLVIIPTVAFGLFTFSFRSGTDAPGQIVTDQSKVTFRISHVSGKVTGTFTGMHGTVIFDESNLPASQMEVSLDANSINTENRARDSDLRKEKFFHVEKYPQISFRSKEVSQAEAGFQVRGDLTIKDITREVIIPFTYEKKGAVAIFNGTFTVNRKDYNLGKSSFPPIGKEAIVTINAVVR